MKKILMVTMSDHTSFQDGVFSMYENLKGRYEITTLTMKNSDYPAPNDKNNLFIDAPKRPGITKDTFNLYRLHQMMNMIRKTDFDTVYFESFHVWNYPIMLYCKRKHIPIAHAINDVIPHEGDSMVRLKDWLNELTVILSDEVILRSANGLKNAIQRFPSYKEKMCKVDLWYSFPAYCPPKGKTVLFFGRLNRYKGIDYLLELIKRTPDIQYVIAGKADDSVNDALNALKEMSNVKLDEGVIPYSKMHDYFYNAVCTILPYQTATQSGVILDAYKHSRPAVAFDVGALGEQIDDGITGYLANPGDVMQLEIQLRKMINMPHEQYERMCKNAYQKGLEEYSAKSREKEFLSAIGIEGGQ